MVWIWFLPWIAYLIPLVLLGVIGLRATLQIVVVLMPQYFPVARTVDRITLGFLRVCLRILLSVTISCLTLVLYALLVLSFMARVALGLTRRAGARVPGTLLVPLPEALPRPPFWSAVNHWLIGHEPVAGAAPKSILEPDPNALSTDGGRPSWEPLPNASRQGAVGRPLYTIARGQPRARRRLRA